jgi:hypothetical protein
MASHLLTATSATSCRTTLNHKYPDAPLVKVLAMSGHRTDPATIAMPSGDLPLLGNPGPELLTRARPVRQLEQVTLTTTARRILAGALPKRRPDGAIDRSASLVAMARVLLGVGLPAAAIAEALAERDAALGWRKYSGRADAAQQYQRIVTFLQHQHR